MGARHRGSRRQRSLDPDHGAAEDRSDADVHALVEEPHSPRAAHRRRARHVPQGCDRVRDDDARRSALGHGEVASNSIDVWIIKSMALRYGLEGWKPSQIAHFGRTHFGPFAGLAQQYLFAWERRFGRALKT